MPNLGFSGPNLAVVAYVEVEGVAGASTATNSGITTTRSALGTYLAVLPANLGQSQGRDLIFVQPKGGYGGQSPGANLVAKMAVVDDSDPTTKVVAIFSGDPALSASTRVDSDFSLLILRTTISPPAGSPS